MFESLILLELSSHPSHCQQGETLGRRCIWNISYMLCSSLTKITLQQVFDEFRRCNSVNFLWTGKGIFGRKAYQDKSYLFQDIVNPPVIEE